MYLYSVNNAVTYRYLAGNQVKIDLIYPLYTAQFYMDLYATYDQWFITFLMIGQWKVETYFIFRLQLY